MSSKVPAISIRADPSTSVTGNASAQPADRCSQGGGDGRLDAGCSSCGWATGQPQRGRAAHGGPAGDGGEDSGGDRDVSAEDADMVQRRRERLDAGDIDGPGGRLEADDPAVVRGNPDDRRCRCPAPPGTRRRRPARPSRRLSPPRSARGRKGCALRARPGVPRPRRTPAGTWSRRRRRPPRAAPVITGASPAAGAAAMSCGFPLPRGFPAMSIMSFTAMGTPCRGPSGRRAGAGTC